MARGREANTNYGPLRVLSQGCYKTLLVWDPMEFIWHLVMSPIAFVAHAFWADLMASLGEIFILAKMPAICHCTWHFLLIFNFLSLVAFLQRDRGCKFVRRICGPQVFFIFPTEGLSL